MFTVRLIMVLITLVSRYITLLSDYNAQYADIRILMFLITLVSRYIILLSAYNTQYSDVWLTVIPPRFISIVSHEAVLQATQATTTISRFSSDEVIHCRSSLHIISLGDEF